jgi:hypothetical protein
MVEGHRLDHKDRLTVPSVLDMIGTPAQRRDQGERQRSETGLE